MMPPHRPQQRVQPGRRWPLLSGAYMAAFMSALLAVSYWLAEVPQPVAPRSAPAERQTGLPRAPTTWPQDANLPAAHAEGNAAQSAPPAAELPASGVAPAPVIERQWARAEVASAAPEPAALLAAPGAMLADRVPHRSPALRRQRVQQFGGTPESEDAVEAGLAWLAAHQDADGNWDRFEFGRHCPADDPCPGRAVHAEGYSFDPGLTGLVLLAFLGAGYTDRQGPYQQVVGRSVAALLAAQNPDGGFGRDARMAGYNNALATFALAEYHALTRDPRVVAPLERAVARLALSQQELGGWDYTANRESGRNDTSITGWAVQALNACVAAGIHVPRSVLLKAALHFAHATQPDGRVRYADAGTGFRIDEQTLQPVYRYGPAMTAVGLTCEQLLGWRFDSPVVLRQRALLLGEPPSAGLLQGGDRTQLHSYYYWYYGTIAMFQAGGQHWQRWNAALRDAILPLQERRQTAGRRSHAFGSWPPFGTNWGRWGRQGSRVYTTAICTLTLEVYYRHLPAYLEERPVLSAADWLAFLRQAEPAQRRRGLEALTQMRLEVAEPVLVELLGDAERPTALAAALSLAGLDSPLGRPLLEAALATTPAPEREALIAALERTRQIEALPPARGTVQAFDAQRGLATLDLPRAYVGMRVDVLRDATPIAHLRVVRRFSGHTLVVAELAGALPGPAPARGAAVVGR